MLKVLGLSIFSRLFYISLAKLSSLVFIPYDKSTSLLPQSPLSFLLRWDAIYFNEIAQNGYTTEQSTAFFPLYPFLCSFVAKILNVNSITAGVLLSNLFFILSALLLYRITLDRYRKETGFLTVLFFIFNPSSIIYSSMYSESTFTFLFLLGFYFLENNKVWIAALFFCICSLVRSNGVLFSVFILFSSLNIYQVFICLILMNIPFAIFQGYILYLIRRTSIHLSKKWFIPYTYVQQKYWNQGFMKFYNMTNLPNFLCALPFLIFSCYSILSYTNSKVMKHKWGILTTQQSRNTFCLVLILTLQTVLCIFFVHAQMFFRFASFNPFLYWSLALVVNSRLWVALMVMLFYFNFGVVYSVLFGSYHPPA